MSFNWTFEQISGPASQRKKIELAGWSAPFGRPRQGAVVKELLKSRIQTTRYPGSTQQSRHAFGTNWEPMELHGRFMTKAMDFTTANEIADTWVAFVQDERNVRVSWGYIVSYNAYISELELGRESEHEVSWRMKLEVDGRDESTGPNRAFTAPVSDDLEALSKLFVQAGIKQLDKVPDDIDPDFFESLNALAGQLNKFSAAANAMAGRFDDIEKATFSTIQHFRGAIMGMKTAILTTREVVLNAAIDSVLLVRNHGAWTSRGLTFREDFDLYPEGNACLSWQGIQPQRPKFAPKKKETIQG